MTIKKSSNPRLTPLQLKLYAAANEKTIQKAAYLFKQGESMYEEGELENAIKLYDEAAELCPYYLRIFPRLMGIDFGKHNNFIIEKSRQYGFV